DRATLHGMLELQRAHAALLTGGEWTPLAAASADGSVVGSRWRRGGEELWALVNRRVEPWSGEVSLDGRSLACSLPERGLAAVSGKGVLAGGGGGTAFPARTVERVAAHVAPAATVPAPMVEGPPPRPLHARFRVRETGIYGEAPFVEEWKP